MSRFKLASTLGALVLFSSACSQQEPATAPTPTGAAAEVPAAAPAAGTALAGMSALTAEQLGEERPNDLGSCNVEAVDGVTFTGDSVKATRKPVTVGGWFLPSQTKKAGNAASLRLVNEAGTEGWEGPISTWTARPDVNSAVGSTDQGNAGFVYNLDLSNIAPGTYAVSVTYDIGADKFACNHPKKIVVE